MSDLLSMVEKSVFWLVVLLSIGLVTYLSHRQYRNWKLRRWHRRHRHRQRTADMAQANQGLSPKPEIRRPKEDRSPKPQVQNH
jgi:predicted alpha/beta hydrolase